ncbi:MAG: beta-glucosidase [Mycobacteriales bacterium]|jgi:beta-glucosidase
MSTPVSPTTDVPTTDVAADIDGSDVHFPNDFIWGAATASYQIEGAATADGRGPSIWDTFSHTPGRVANGDTGDVANDHYNRYVEDVALLATLGVKAYRFSVSWPRVQPTGQGPANAPGLDFYRRLTDTLLEHGIEPVATLYHWDLPQALQDEGGGWVNRDTSARFADYAGIVAGALGDRVQRWTTLNEPWCSAFLGYASGQHAPGIADPAQAFRAVHHLLLGHGLATHAIRAATLSRAQVSLVLNPAPVTAASDRPADLDAARRVDAVQNRLFLDAVLKGHYPADLPGDAARWTKWDFVKAGDEHVIATPLDMLGVNYYQPLRVAAADTDEGSHPGTAGTRMLPPPGARTAMDWEIEPQGLVDVLMRIHTGYPRLPLIVTENGAAFDDQVGADGRVHDIDRVRFLDGHFRAAHTAIQRGVDLRGYFVWSFMDNFEWAEGYARRFGLVYVDYASQRRILKDSGYWFQDVISRGGIVGAPPGGG